MKKILSIAAALLLLCTSARAWFADSLAANYRVPKVVDYTVETPAPKGYKPVYISHYGRHGARFLSDSTQYLCLLEPLAKAKAEGNLTEKGEAFYEACRKLYEDIAKGREGELTPIGWRQHQVIAGQIFDNYRSVFRKHPMVTAKATSYQRCIVSMSSFTLALAEKDPKLRFFTESNGRDYERLLNESARCKPLEPGWDYSQEGFLKTIDPSAVLGRIFKDPTKVADAPLLGKYIYRLVKSTACIDPSINLAEGIMNEEDMIPFYQCEVLRFYERCGVMKNRFLPVIQGIIDDADADLAEDVPPVRLRFGHDIVQTSILAILDIDGFGATPECASDACRVMPIHRIPMACTLLFVFYRKGDSVLVKILLDGKETHLPIEAVEGPYYDWNDFKAYFVSLQSE